MNCACEKWKKNIHSNRLKYNIEANTRQFLHQWRPTRSKSYSALDSNSIFHLRNHHYETVTILLLLLPTSFGMKFIVITLLCLSKHMTNPTEQNKTNTWKNTSSSLSQINTGVSGNWTSANIRYRSIYVAVFFSWTRLICKHIICRLYNVAFIIFVIFCMMLAPLSLSSIHTI